MGGSLSHSLTAALATASSSASPAAAAAAGGLPPVIWYAPFLSGGGYCSEATAFVLGLRADGVDVQIVQHGDAQSDPPAAQKGNPCGVPLPDRTTHSGQLPSVLLQKVISVV